MNKMRKVIGILMSLTMALCFAFAIGCAEEEPKKSLSLSESAVTMSLFDETTLTVTKSNISEEVEWTITDNTVVHIVEREDGVQLIAIKADASTTITATAGGKSASCTVTVEPSTDTLTLSRSVAGNLVLFEEEDVDPVTALGMNVAFGGEAFTKANMEYVLTNVEPAGCITIEEGILTAVAEGTASLTAKAAYYGNYSNEITVDVEVYPEITVDFLDIAGNDVTLYTAGTNTKVEVKADLVWGSNSISAPTLKSAVSANDQVATWDSENSKVKAVGVGETTITFTYEFKTTRVVVGVLNVTVMENPLYYGQHEKFAVNGVVAKMTEGDALAYEGVSLTNDENSPLIRLQIVQSVDNVHEGTYAHPNGARDIYITIQDAENPLNYITVLVTSYKYAADGDWAFGAFNIGARASVWGSHVIGDTSDAFYGQRVGKNANPVGVGLNTTSGGWDGGANGFSFFENFLTTPKDGNDSLTDNMIAISVKEQTVYFHINGEVFSLLDMSQSVAGQKVWPGFDNGAKANIYVAVGGFNNADHAYLVIDTIDNSATTSADVDEFKVVKNGTSLVPEFTHTHVWNETYTKTSGEHWIECSNVCCFEIKEGTRGAHDTSTGACICGETHTHSWEPAYDRTSHYEKCGCGETQNAVAHTVVDGECECGYIALRYGQDALWAHDGVLADVRSGESITMNGVALPTYNDGLGVEEALVRFQYIPETTGGLRPVGPQVIYITIADAENSANSIKLMIVQYATDAPATHACVGAKVQDSSPYKGVLGTLTLIGTDTIEGYGTDTNSFSFVGTHLNESDYGKYMMGIVVNGTTVSMQSAGENLVILDLADEGWTGFTSSNVNVTISFARYLNNSTVGTLSFDVLGGVATSADSVANFSIVDCGSTYVPAAYLPQA